MIETLVTFRHNLPVAFACSARSEVVLSEGFWLRRGSEIVRRGYSAYKCMTAIVRHSVMADLAADDWIGAAMSGIVVRAAGRADAAAHLGAIELNTHALESWGKYHGLTFKRGKLNGRYAVLAFDRSNIEVARAWHYEGPFAS